jgi:OOP family OmpA-OmpF porin
MRFVPLLVAGAWCVLATGCPAAPAPVVVAAKAPEPAKSAAIPTIPGLDVDEDGILDVSDKCPNAPEDKDGVEDDDGCPDGDDDKDRIFDPNDKCPLEAETYNGIEDDDGCPEKLKIIYDPEPPIIEYVRFVGPGATIAPQSKPLLDEVAKVMKDHPEVELVEVAGHTDEQGSAAANAKLSQARAQAVVDALVNLGVPAARLRAQGFGGWCPLAPEHTPAAWEKNRRAELKVMKKDGAPTGVVTGCAAATEHGLVSKPVP